MTAQDKEQIRRELGEVVGKAVLSVQRVFYTIGDEVQRNEGPLQLALEDGSAILFQSGANGQDLVVKSERWLDPFAGELSEENQQYVAEYGKWSLFDVSDEVPYTSICGITIASFHEIHLREQSEAEGFPVAKAMAEGWEIDWETIVGVLLRIDGLTIRAESIMDELRVDVTAEL